MKMSMVVYFAPHSWSHSPRDAATESIQLSVRDEASDLEASRYSLRFFLHFNTNTTIFLVVQTVVE